MGGLINWLIGKLTEQAMDKGIEAAGERAQNTGFRRIALAAVLAGSTWMAVAGTLLWECAALPGVRGLWQYVREGDGPAWTLAGPALAALTALVALIPATGRHSLNALFAAGAFGFSLAALGNFQIDGHSDVNGPAVSTILVSLVVVILALALAFGDVPALDAPLAHASLVYWGRLRHLKALRRYGQQCGLAVSEPGGRDMDQTLTGMYDPEHPVKITSGASFKLSSRSQTAFFLEVRMGSPRDIVAFRIGWTPAPKQLRGRVVGGELKVSAVKRLYFYVVPDPRMPVGQEFIQHLARVVEEGLPFLHSGDYVQATPHGIRYYHRARWFGLPPRDAALDPTIRWMRQLVGLLETVTPLDSAAPVRAGVASYGQVGRGSQPSRR